MGKSKEAIEANEAGAFRKCAVIDKYCDQTPQAMCGNCLHAESHIQSRIDSLVMELEGELPPGSEVTTKNVNHHDNGRLGRVIIEFDEIYDRSEILIQRGKIQKGPFDTEEYKKFKL